MTIPVGQPIALPAQVIVTDRVPPAVLRATVTFFDGSRYQLELAEGSASVAAGDALVLDLQAPDSPLVQGRIASVEGRVVGLEVQHSRSREPREFPRIEGDLAFRYCVAHATLGPGEIMAWLSGGPTPTEDAAWHHPCHVLDWSAAGLGFQDLLHLREGDGLLIEIEAGERTSPMRALARVIRVVPLARPEHGATHRVAVDLERMTPEDREDLLALSIERQGAQPG